MERMDTSEDDDFNTRSQVFLTWLQQEKGATISSKIELADLRDQRAGRGVVATQDLAEDEELFSIPRSAILTLESTSLPETTKNAILEANDDPWLSLIVGMVLEYLKGVESPWKPYFDILPQEFDTLMFWTDAELELLEGSMVVHKIGKEKADATFLEQLIPLIGQVATSLQIAGKKSNEELLALCHRMGSTIMAYAFDLEKPSSSGQNTKNEEDGWEEDEDQAILPKGMVPLADMLNADADRNNAKLFYEDDKVVMKTIAPVKKGEELYNDFGPLPRADLLRRYGYVTDNYAKYDLVDVPADMIKDVVRQETKISAQDLDERWAYLEEQGVLDDGYDVARAGSEDGQFPEELCALLNLLVTPKAEFDKLRKKDKLPNADLTTEARKLLRTILVHRFAQYPMESELSEPTSAQVDMHRRHMALDVLAGERKVLHEAVESVTESGSGSSKRKADDDTLTEEAFAVRKRSKN